jgi:hypothetical protein
MSLLKILLLLCFIAFISAFPSQCVQTASAETSDGPVTLLEEEYVFDLEEEEVEGFGMGSIPSGGFRPPTNNFGPSVGNTFKPVAPTHVSTPSTTTRTTPSTVGTNFGNSFRIPPGISAVGVNYLTISNQFNVIPSGLFFFLKQFSGIQLAQIYGTRFFESLTLARLYDKSSCKDKKVCEYNCKSLFPLCSGKTGFLDFTREINVETTANNGALGPQGLAYNNVCKRNLFSSADQKKSAFSIIFRLLVFSVTQLPESQFEHETTRRIDLSKYDQEYIDWNERKGIDENDIAVLNALNLYKEGLKGFLLICQENPLWMAQLEDKLTEYEQESEETARHGTSSEVNSDSAARASQITASWGVVSNAIGTAFGSTPKNVIKANFGIPNNFNTLTANLLLPNKFQKQIQSTLWGKTSPSNSNYQKRIILFGKLKEALRGSFLEMVKGTSTQRDFCQCFDYTNLFRFVHSLTPQAAVTFGLPQDQLAFEFDYSKRFEDNCRSECGTAARSSKCPNNGIEQLDGSCSYNFYLSSIVEVASFPMTYKQNEALKFTVTGGPVDLVMAQSSSVGSRAYTISISRTKTQVFLSTLGNSKSKISLGSSSQALNDGQALWVTMYSNVLKVGLGSVGSREILSIPITIYNLFTPSVVGFVKTSESRTTVMNAKFSKCSGNGQMTVPQLNKSPTCKCSNFYSGNFCETSILQSITAMNRPFSAVGNIAIGIIRR